MSVIPFTTLTASQHGGAILHNLLRLRHQEFVERQNYDVFTSPHGIEYDKYDYIETVHMAAVDDQRRVLGTSRLNPTSLPYMIEEVFPYLVDPSVTLPKSTTVWESSRFCIDRNLPLQVREVAKIQLVYAQQKFCLENEIEYMVGIMSPAIWRAVFEKYGWKIEPLGEVKYLPDGSKVMAGKMLVSEAILEAIRGKGGLNEEIFLNSNIRIANGMVGGVYGRS